MTGCPIDISDKQWTYVYGLMVAFFAMVATTFYYKVFKFKKTITVQELNIFPLKSGKGILKKEIEIDRFGFKHDRRWMVVDADNTFVSQRTKPRMALIHVKVIDDNSIELSYEGKASVVLKKNPKHEQFECTLWDDKVVCAHCPEGDEWISDLLKSKCKVVYQSIDYVRKIDPKYDLHPREKNIEVDLADGYPILVISEASLDALNKRLKAKGEDPVLINRFRPNIYVTGCEAHEEDNWKLVKINGELYDVVKKCARCSMPTNEQSTGKRHKRYEPIKTLREYRQLHTADEDEPEVFFGMNLIPRKKSGKILLGNEVEILE